MPLNIIATVTAQSSTNCVLHVVWDPPINASVSYYIIYLPLQTHTANESSANLSLSAPTCSSNNIGIKVVAVNQFGCQGPNVSTEVQPMFLPGSTTKDRSVTTVSSSPAPTNVLCKCFSRRYI